jgi:hypothetical protein
MALIALWPAAHAAADADPVRVRVALALDHPVAHFVVAVDLPPE